MRRWPRRLVCLALLIILGEAAGGEKPSAAAPADTPGIRLIRTQPADDVELLQAHEHLLAGNFAAARLAYRQVLKREARNVDALLGLAVISRHSGQHREAGRYFAQALEADPRNDSAQAAGIAGSAGGDPIGAESRLRNLLAARPESAPLNFQLGNLLARRQRWAEARQAYAAALAGDGDNPDHHFNLAVSLEHLGRSTDAASHYRLALAAASRRAAAFAPQSAERRLQALAGAAGGAP